MRDHRIVTDRDEPEVVEAGQRKNCRTSERGRRPEFAHVDGIPDAGEAERAAMRLAVEMLDGDPILAQLDSSRLVVLGRSRIPPEVSGDASQFLALHFERGQPLFPTKPETLYLFLALFMSPDQPASRASTRIASVEGLFAECRSAEVRDVEAKLRGYGASHGSSWDWDGDSGGRVSCFARVVDALAPEPVLTNFRQIPKDQWYERSKAANEFESLEEEREFYLKRGLDLDAVEHAVVLKPGELLLINNVRAVHGRGGEREPEELHQFLIGIPDVPPEEAGIVRRWLTSTAAGCG